MEQLGEAYNGTDTTRSIGTGVCLNLECLVIHTFMHFQAVIKQGEDLDEATEEDFYLRRLDAGLFTLQLIDCVVVECCSSGNASVNMLFLYFICIL